MPRSLKEGADYFTAVALSFPTASRRALVKAAKCVRDESKRVLGTYDYGWTPLKRETVERKATGDSPLLETGELRNSIKYSVGKNVATVGTNNPKGLWHEFGTSRIPPRPFLLGAAITKEKEVKKICGHDLFDFMMKGRYAGEEEGEGDE